MITITTAVLIGLCCLSAGACFGAVLMGAIIGNREATEAPKPYGSHAEWKS